MGGGQWVSDKNDKILANHQENVRRALEKLDCHLSFDLFAQRQLVKWGEFDGLFDDHARNRLWLEIDRQFHFRPTAEFFDIVVQDVAYEHRFHPVLDYLAGVKWDGKERLDEWLITYAKAADTPYVRAISSMVLIAAVRRVRQPGCKFDELVVLESGQGLNKSSALRTLCPRDEWFSDDLPLDVDAKQVIERTLGKWIIEAGELAGMRQSQVEQLKAMLSRQVDGPVRMAYGRISTERRRQFVCIGTTNSETYLKDTTGNRRFWPIRVEAFNVDGIRFVRDQLWAEAAHRETLGESIRLAPELYPHATFQQERRRAEDPWETKLDEKFPRTQKWRLTPDDVWHAIGITIDRRDEKSNERIMRAMTKLKFRRVTVKVKDENGVEHIVKGFGRDKGEGQEELFD
jgi:predicted P-loop ATPase